MLEFIDLYTYIMHQRHFQQWGAQHIPIFTLVHLLHVEVWVWVLCSISIQTHKLSLSGTHKHTWISTRVHTHTCTHIYTCTHIHTTHTQAHTHTHTHTHTVSLLSIPLSPSLDPLRDKWVRTLFSESPCATKHTICTRHAIGVTLCSTF